MPTNKEKENFRIQLEKKMASDIEEIKQYVINIIKTISSLEKEVKGKHERKKSTAD